MERARFGPLLAFQPLDCQRQGHVAACDRRCARASVRLDDIAVDDDLALAQFIQVHRRSQAAANQPRDLLRAPLRPHRLAINPLVRAARQHRVLSRHPTVALRRAVQPARQTLLHRRVAQDFRVPHADQHRAFRVEDIIEFELDRAQFILGPSLRSHAYSVLLSRVSGGVGRGWNASSEPSEFQRNHTPLRGRAQTGRRVRPRCIRWG